MSYCSSASQEWPQTWTGGRVVTEHTGEMARGYWHDGGAMKFLVTRLKKDVEGVIAIKFALLAPVFLLSTAIAIDYSALASQKSDLQGLADVGAIAGAKELSFSDANRENVNAVVQAVVERYVAAQDTAFNNTSITTTAVVTENPLRVSVTVESVPVVFFKDFLAHSAGSFGATSVAEIIGKPNVCVLALEPSRNGALSLEHDANVLGRECTVFSNSTHTNAIKAKNSSRLTADFICSAGGKSGGPGNFDPEPMTDCPGFDDPLGSRPEPFVPAACDHTDFVIDFGSRALAPGTYCGGITVGGGATVTLDPGTYIIKDGLLAVTDDASLTGTNVGFYFTGDDAGVEFTEDSTISLEAQESGVMAGLLFFSDRQQSNQATYRIMSEDARVLLGTIYLPNGELHVGADGPVADQSAYTAIVARSMHLYGGPQLVLNTNYDETDVPVPDGIRGAGQPVKLVQ